MRYTISTVSPCGVQRSVLSPGTMLEADSITSSGSGDSRIASSHHRQNCDQVRTSHSIAAGRHFPEYQSHGVDVRLLERLHVFQIHPGFQNFRGHVSRCPHLGSEETQKEVHRLILKGLKMRLLVGCWLSVSRGFFFVLWLLPASTWCVLIIFTLTILSYFPLTSSEPPFANKSSIYVHSFLNIPLLLIRVACITISRGFTGS